MKYLLTALCVCQICCGMVWATQNADSISTNVTELSEIIVTDQIVKITEEGMNYSISNIQGSDLADAGSVLDMLSWVPGVTVDAAENVKILGVSASPLIYINGVMTTDMTKLSLLTSNMVKKIEVIRAPGAEYPAGTECVLRITTVIPLKDILNANIIERANQRRRFSNKLTANTYGSFGRFDVFASVGLKSGNSRQSSIASENIFSKDQTLLKSVVTCQKDIIKTKRVNWMAGIAYHFSESDDVQIEYSGSSSNRLRDFLSNYTVQSSDLYLLTNYDARNKSKPVNHSLLGTYTHEFDNSTLIVSATYNHKQSNNSEGVYLMPENQLNAINYDRYRYDMWTFQGDYSWKFFTKDKQSIGLYGGRVDNTSNSEYTFTGVDDVKSTIVWGEFYYSTYLEVNGYGFTPGVRMRYENQQSRSLTDESRLDYNKSYFNVVPQLSIYHRFSKSLAINLYYKWGYSLPDFSELSPAITLANLVYYTTGNPDLKVPRRHNLAMVFNLPSLTIVGEFTALRNKIATITSPINETDYFLERPINMSGNYNVSLRANYNRNFASKFRIYAMAMAFMAHSQYYYLDELRKRDRLSAMISVNGSCQLRPNLSLFASAIYVSPQLIDNMTVGHTCNISFGGNLRLLKNRLNLRLEVEDILARAVTPYWDSFSPNLYRTRHNYYDTRGVVFTASYRFTFAKQNYSELDNADDYYRM